MSFDPHLTCSLRTVRAISDNIASHWLYVRDIKYRRRRMRKADAENRKLILQAVLANLALAAQAGTHPSTVGVSLGTAYRRGTRYDREGFRTLPMVAGMLAEGSSPVLSLHVSSRKGEASTFTAAPWFASLVGRLKPTSGDFGQAPGGETIVLSRVVERDYVAGTKRTERVDYKRDPEADRFRREMEAVNQALSAADIAFLPDGGSPVVTSDRHLKRHFSLPPDPLSPSQRFDLGGRLFGGWWSGLPKARRHAIRIEGEPIADLDFASMFLRLA